MLRERALFWRTAFIVVDLTVSMAVFLASYALRLSSWCTAWLPLAGDAPPLEPYLTMLPVLCVVLFLTNSHCRLYQPRRISRLAEELWDILRSNAIALVLLLAVFFFARQFSYSRSMILIFAALNPMAVFLFRAGIRLGLRALRSGGRNLRWIVVVGTGRAAQSLLHRLRRNPWTGIRVMGLVSLSPARVGSSIHGCPVIGHVADLGKVLDEARPDQAFVALPLEERRSIEQTILLLSERLIPTRFVPDMGFLLQHPVTFDFDGLPIVNLWESQVSGWSVALKRGLDIGLAGSLLALLSPLIVLVALALKLLERGPAFFVQPRMGHDGRIFPMVKFRTMAVGAEDDTRFTQPGDDRCTRLGRVLRRTSLDELPQLINVLVGHMSLVGPRPERPVFIETFRKTLPHYMLRHRLKAGMTGWAQINGWRGATSLRKRLQYDLYYLRHWSLAFDVKILILTLLRGWRQENAY